MTAEEVDLIAALKPNTDLARLVDQVARANLPWVVVSSAAVVAWERKIQPGGRKYPIGWPSRVWRLCGSNTLRGVKIAEVTMGSDRSPLRGPRDRWHLSSGLLPAQPGSVRTVRLRRLAPQAGVVGDGPRRKRHHA
jgi:hypothetical protein